MERGPTYSTLLLTSDFGSWLTAGESAPVKFHLLSHLGIPAFCRLGWLLVSHPHTDQCCCHWLCIPPDAAGYLLHNLLSTVANHQGRREMHQSVMEEKAGRDVLKCISCGKGLHKRTLFAAVLCTSKVMYVNVNKSAFKLLLVKFILWPGHC